MVCQMFDKNSFRHRPQNVWEEAYWRGSKKGNLISWYRSRRSQFIQIYYKKKIQHASILKSSPQWLRIVQEYGSQYIGKEHECRIFFMFFFSKAPNLLSGWSEIGTVHTKWNYLRTECQHKSKNEKTASIQLYCNTHQPGTFQITKWTKTFL